MGVPCLRIVFDNYPYRSGLTTLWGFAAVIQLPGQTILFDTGSNGRVLLRNMAALKIDPSSVDWVFLSHPHWDHIGGLDSFLEVNPNVDLVLHEGFSKHLINDLRGQCGELVTLGGEPKELADGVYSTGMLKSDPPEQALVFDTDDGAVVVSGCAHPGMSRIVEYANGFMPDGVAWAVGGFHLMYASSADIDRAIVELQHIGVTRVLPTHCTGDQAKAAFHQAYGEACLDGGVGREIVFGSPSP